MPKFPSDNSQVVVFAAGFLSSAGRRESLTAGGDVRAVQVLSRAPKGIPKLKLLSSRDGIRAFSENAMTEFEGLSIDNAFVRKSNRAHFVAVLYLIRGLAGIVRGLTMRSRTSRMIAYSVSNTFPDVFVCATLRLVGKTSAWITVVHHWSDPGLFRYGSGLERILSAAAASLNCLLVSALADRVVAYNQPTIDRLLRAGYPQSAITVNGNGVSLTEIGTAGALGGRRKPNSAVYVGRLSNQKGVIELLSVWRRVLMTLPEATLALVGAEDTLSYGDVEAEANALGIAHRIEICGVLSRKKMIEKVANSTVSVNPSFSEGWSLSILESLACRTPVVAWDLPVYREIYGSAIMTAPIGDHDAFADAIVKVLTNEETRSILASRGEKVAVQYSWDSIASTEWRVITEKGNTSRVNT